MGMYEVVYCSASAVGTYALSQMMHMLYGKSRTGRYVTTAVVCRLFSGIHRVISGGGYTDFEYPV
jgi:hypothetical protein